MTKKVILLIAVAIAAATAWILFNKYRVVLPPVDVSQSEIGWSAKSVSGSHNGKIQLAKADVQLQNGQVIAVNVVADMKTISVDDITDPQHNQDFIQHITTEDFFEVEKFPTATFQSTEVKPGASGTWAIAGKLMIKGVTRDVSFTASSAADGTALQATLPIDRTTFGIVYGAQGQRGSEKDWFIHDEFLMTVNLRYGK
jgi:polyisoprenoid-binding protein YceI